MEAKEWLSDMLWRLWGPRPEDFYHEGDFQGVMFARPYTKTDRDKAVKLVKEAGMKEGRTRYGRSQTFPSRSMRRTISYSAGLQVDAEASTLKAGVELVAPATDADRSLHLTWGTAWEDWKGLREDGEAVELIRKYSVLLRGVG